MSILRACHVSKNYTIRSAMGKKRIVRALEDVSFELRKGSTLGIVGESGSGKSTLARLLAGLEEPSRGEIGPPPDRDTQMVFQDPEGSLNPRQNCWRLICAPLLPLGVPAKERRQRALAMMETVGLAREDAERFPHMFSGGQRQRIGIARALIARPRVLICDEPVSALVVSIQAQILNLFVQVRREFSLSCVFISHDLQVIKHVSDDILVMHKGRAVEHGSREQIFAEPRHPHTKELLATMATFA